MIAYPSKILIYRIIWNPDNHQVPLFQFFCSYLIFYLLFFIIMLGTVQLDDQSCFVTVEIYDVVIDYFLTKKTNRIIL